MRAPLLALLLLPAAPVPDLLLPGHKGVRHELVLEWGDDVGGYRFVASPVAGLHGNVEIRRGVPFRFSSKYHTRIYAAPAGAAPPDPRESLRDVSWASADVPVREVASVAAGHPLARVETVLRVRGVGPERIQLERVAERRFDALGFELGGLDWLPLALLALAGGAWAVRLEREGRSRRAPAPSPT